MKHPVLLKALGFAILLAFVACAPESALAQRGGHGGGGGFHGGGGAGFHGGSGGYHGGGGYYGGNHGGGYYGGYHGGGGYYASGYHGGWRGGYYGGGYWGYPAFGWGWGSGWGFGISVGWGSYWPDYSYSYGLAPAWPVPYYPYPSYYYAAPVSYAAATGYAVAAPNYLGAYSRGAAGTAASPARESAPAAAAGEAPVVLRNASYRTNPAIRPEVKTAIRALLGMPPSARQAQLSRYTDLSPAERDLVIQIADVPES